jgi:hypothetical protein
MGLKKLFLITVLAGAMSVLGCGDDDSSSGNGNGNGNGNGGPNCTQELCMNNETLSANCQREYDSCIATGALTQQECLVFAEETCTV